MRCAAVIDGTWDEGAPGMPDGFARCIRDAGHSGLHNTGATDFYDREQEKQFYALHGADVDQLGRCTLGAACPHCTLEVA